MHAARAVRRGAQHGTPPGHAVDDDAGEPAGDEPEQADCQGDLGQAVHGHLDVSGMGSIVRTVQVKAGSRRTGGGRSGLGGPGQADRGRHRRAVWRPAGELDERGRCLGEQQPEPIDRVRAP